MSKGDIKMSQAEKMLTYAKAYAREVLRGNRGRVMGIFLSGTLAVELQGKIEGYTGKRSDVDIEIIGNVDEREFDWPPEEEWPSICEGYFLLEGGEKPMYHAYGGKLVAGGHNLNLIELLKESRDGVLIGLIHTWYPLYDPKGVLEKLRKRFPRVSEETKRKELSRKVFDAFMALDDAKDLYENGKYEDLIFCVLEGIIPFGFVIPYLHGTYDTSSKQRFRTLKETSPEIAKFVLEIIEEIEPTEHVCKSILLKSEKLIEDISVQLKELGYEDLLREKRRLVELHRFSTVLEEKRYVQR